MFLKTMDKPGKAIGTDLPAEPVNVIKEDPENENVLYVGTDHGMYVSLNRGTSFMAMSGGLPAVAVHDVAVHQGKKEIVLGTHGRSFWVGSVAELQELNDKMMDETIYAFAIGKQRFSSRWGAIRNQYTEARTPKVMLPFYTATPGNMAVEIRSEKGVLLKQLTHKSNRGLNYLEYDLSIEKSAVKAYEKELNKEAKRTDQSERGR